MNLIPFFDPESLVSTAMGWIVDNQMAAAAQAGVSVGPEVYNTLAPRMTKAPSDLMVAYEQAVYFIALAARRALRNRETQASSTLLNALAQVQAEGDQVHQDISWACSTLGVFCPSRGGGEVLSDAIDVIESSGLNSDDMITITSILRANKRAYQFLQVLPYLAVAGVSTLTLLWWRSRK